MDGNIEYQFHILHVCATNFFASRSLMQIRDYFSYNIANIVCYIVKYDIGQSNFLHFKSDFKIMKVSFTENWILDEFFQLNTYL